MGRKSYKTRVDVYDESVYVDTETGEGMARVLERIDPLLCKMASKSYMSGYDFNDLKQELAAIAIEGILSFNPDKKVKLSTFLHIHLRNKMVSKLRSVNKISNDAFSLHQDQDPNDKLNGSGLRRSRDELVFSSIRPKVDKNSEEYGNFEDGLSGDNSIYSAGKEPIMTSDFTSSILKLYDSIDNKTAKIIELVCLNDYSIKDAAEEVGLTGWAASMRLKKLNKNRVIKDILNKK
jgi:RNA polymerase sigma factor (sigma-70 family)|tara:strand:- start:1883 stop:2587 length:705 start_codon:yes stop_codon:yes gene_type:complete